MTETWNHKATSIYIIYQQLSVVLVILVVRWCVEDLWAMYKIIIEEQLRHTITSMIEIMVNNCTVMLVHCSNSSSTLTSTLSNMSMWLPATSSICTRGKGGVVKLEWVYTCKKWTISYIKIYYFGVYIHMWGAALAVRTFLHATTIFSAASANKAMH